MSHEWPEAEMVHVTVELRLWLGNELGEGFQSASAMCSLLETEVEDGSTVQELFEVLAECYEIIERKVFTNQEFSPNVTVIINDRVTSLTEAYNRVLEEGDKITLIPTYAGG